MKKSTLLAVSGLIIIFIIITSFGDKTKVYDKQVRYDTPEEAITNFIGYANSYEVVKNRNGYYNITPKEFLESISRRYRLYLNDYNSNKYINEQIPIFLSYEISEVNIENLGNLRMNYEETFSNIPKYPKAREVRTYKLSALVIYNNEVDKVFVNSDGTVNKEGIYKSYDEIYKQEMSNEEIGTAIDFYLIVIDEGDGYVVDYYTIEHK